MCSIWAGSIKAADCALRAGSIKGNVKRKFFSRDGGVRVFSSFSPFRQQDDRSHGGKLVQPRMCSWGSMMLASNYLAILKRQQAVGCRCANHGSI
jgi:hypothetical protein